MADAVGVSLRAAQEWEYGGGVDDEHLGALLSFLETDAEFLFRGAAGGDETPDLVGALEGADPLVNQLERIERNQQEILEGIDALASALLSSRDADRDETLAEWQAHRRRRSEGTDPGSESQPGG